MRKLIAGNWKMNGLLGDLATIDAMIAGLGDDDTKAEALICPPFTSVSGFATRADDSILQIGAQTCHASESGAHTGDVSAGMLADAGATYVILGHSERRNDHGETDNDVKKKVEAACKAGLTPIVCVGEHLADRERGATMEIVLGQLADSLPDSLKGSAFVVAYEPIWAIGTGLTASTDQIAEVHAAVRNALVERFEHHGKTIRILYGGSMKPSNASEILAVENVNGGLIGGASLKADDFLAIYKAAL